MNSMIKRISLVVCAVACLVCSGGAAEEWCTDFEQGLAVAAAEGRPLLVEFTGSDWCPPCMYVRSKVLPSKEFQGFVKKYNPVLVELDFPREISPELRAQREVVAERYMIDAFPTMLVADSQGHACAMVVGGGNGVKGYVLELQQAMETKAKLENDLKQAYELSGFERATALIEIYNSLQPECRPLRQDITDAVAECDPEDRLGLRKMLEQKKIAEEQTMAFSEMICATLEDSDGTAKARAGAMEMLKRDDLQPSVRLIINAFIGQSLALDKKYAQACPYIEAAVAADPESLEAACLKELLPLLRANASGSAQ